MPADILAYWNAHAAAEAAQGPQQWDEWMPAPQVPTTLQATDRLPS